jgi:hypothetical protein
MHTMFIETFFIMAKLWKQPRYLTIDEWIKRIWTITQSKGKWNYVICRKMGRTGDHLAKWDEPSSIGQIPRSCPLVEPRPAVIMMVMTVGHKCIQWTVFEGQQKGRGGMGRVKGKDIEG